MDRIRDMKKTLFNSKPGMIVLILLVLLFSLWVIFLLYNVSRPRSSILDPSQIVLRGDRALVLRYAVSSRSLEEIDVDEHGQATHVVLVATQVSQRQDKQLSMAQWRSIEALRRQWCNTPIAFRPLNPNEPFYTVAVRCPSTFRALSLKIPADSLPSALVDLVEHVFAP
jgi:hypothetical protein